MKKEFTTLHQFTIRGTIMSVRVQNMFGTFHYDMWVEDSKGRYHILYNTDKLSPILKQGYGATFKGTKYETLKEDGRMEVNYHAGEVLE